MIPNRIISLVLRGKHFIDCHIKSKRKPEFLFTKKRPFFISNYKKTKNKLNQGKVSKEKKIRCDDSLCSVFSIFFLLFIYFQCESKKKKVSKEHKIFYNQELSVVYFQLSDLLKC